MQRVDHTALKFNQASIISILILAFLLDQVWAVIFVALVMLIGTWFPEAGLFKLLYRHLFKPLGLLKPEIVADEPQPHLFAQGLGGIVLIASAIALLLHAPIAGWLLVGLVVALAAINLFVGFCLGCFLYYQLARRGMRLDLPGWQQPVGQ